MKLAPTELHQFKIATIHDRKEVLEFLRDQWNSEHVYLKSDRLFSYDLIFGNRLNFILAINKEQTIDGILGFIPYSPDYNGSDILTVLWKVKAKNGDPMLGITLLTKLVDDCGFRIVSTVGANPKTLPLYEFLGYRVGQLKHYFILNDQLSVFNICKNASSVLSGNLASPADNKTLIHYKTYDELTAHFCAEEYKDRIPYKSSWYINKRYFGHPYYSYNVIGIRSTEGITNSIIITREITHNESKVLRIVDFIGDESDLQGIGGALKEHLYENNYEYVDFYQYGIAHDIMIEANFLLKDDYKDLIIPNYFEPFLQSNVTINFFTTASNEFYFFKADGDQDRPNKILI